MTPANPSATRWSSTALAVVLALGLSAGCASSAPSTGYTPNTGIQIPAAAITMGHGCGNGVDQVFKYAAVVSAASADGGPLASAPPLASGVFDCFADAVFTNLTSDASPQPYFVSILAFNAASFPQGLTCPPNPPTGSPCPGDDAGAVLASDASANWTTSCTATQLSGTTTIAACGLLVPSNAASVDAGASEGGSGEEGGSDAAGSEAAGSGTDGGEAESGAESGETTSDAEPESSD